MPHELAAKNHPNPQLLGLQARLGNTERAQAIENFAKTVSMGAEYKADRFSLERSSDRRSIPSFLLWNAQYRVMQDIQKGRIQGANRPEDVQAEIQCLLRKDGIRHPSSYKRIARVEFIEKHRQAPPTEILNPLAIRIRSVEVTPSNIKSAVSKHMAQMYGQDATGPKR